MDEEIPIEELVVEHARYDELQELKELVASHGPALLASARDTDGNSAMHMAAANGHEGIIAYLLEHVAPADFAPTNKAGSNPVHWACLNSQLEVLRLMCPSLPDKPLLQKDRGGLTPLEVAESKDALEAAGFLLGVLSMREKAAKGDGKDDTTDLEEDLQAASLDEPKESKPPLADPGPER